MIHKLWVQATYNTHSLIAPSTLVFRGKRIALVPNTGTRIEGASYLSPRNSDGDDRAASPGWGAPVPSKSLIGRHWLETETTDHIDTRSRNGNKQRAITAVPLGACQRLSPDSEPRNWLDPYREGLNPLFNFRKVGVR